MATISLNANMINRMPSMIKQVRQSVEDYKSGLFALKNQTLAIRQSICNLDEVISSIQASTQTQEDKIDSLNDLIRESEAFISDVEHIDGKVAGIIKQRRDEFYKNYYYLKPECEKNWIDKAKDGFASAMEWCRAHWKMIGTVFLVGVAIGIILASAGVALAPLSAFLVAAAKGILIGSVVGGVVGGTVSYAFGGSFWKGFEDGAFGGAISGAISGGLGHILSLGGAVLSMGDLMYIGGTAEFTSSLLGDIGDVFIKGDDLSVEDVMLNAVFSFVIGTVAGLGGYWFNQWAALEISGINKGNGSWKHVWASQSTRSLRHATKVSLKTILKGLGSKAVDDAWDHVFEAAKNLIKELKDLWNFNRKILNTCGV